MQLPCQPVSRLRLHRWQRDTLIGYCATRRESQSNISIPVRTRRRKEALTHRHVKELLCVVQHADPDGDMASRGHGGGSVPGVQCTDAESLRGAKTLPCSEGHRLRLCHAALQRSLPGNQGREAKSVSMNTK